MTKALATTPARPRAVITMRRALEDMNLLGAVPRVLLIAANGEPLLDDERAIFTKLTGREREPLERADELWAVIGRRAARAGPLPF